MKSAEEILKDKKALKDIIKYKCEDVWFNGKNMNMIEELANSITEEIFPMIGSQFTSQQVSLPGDEKIKDFIQKIIFEYNDDNFSIEDMIRTIKKWASQLSQSSSQRAIVFPEEEEIKEQSEIEIDPGLTDDFQTGKSLTAHKRRMWSYGVKWAIDRTKELNK
jgi:hypothetical protein